MVFVLQPPCFRTVVPALWLANVFRRFVSMVCADKNLAWLHPRGRRMVADVSRTTNAPAGTVCIPCARSHRPRPPLQLLQHLPAIFRTVPRALIPPSASAGSARMAGAHLSNHCQADQRDRGPCRMARFVSPLTNALPANVSIISAYPAPAPDHRVS